MGANYSTLKGPPYPHKFRELSSRISLGLMSATATYGFFKLYQRDYPLLLLGPLIFTFIGSTGGLIWEQFGDLNGRTAELAESFRRGNVGLLKAASTLNALITCLGYWNDKFTALVTFIGSFLFWESFLNIPYPAENGTPQGGIARTLAGFLLQFLGVVGLEIYSAFVTHTLLPKQAYINIIGQILSIITLPLVTTNSFLYHTINSVASFLTYKYLDSFVSLPPSPKLRWEHALGGLLGGFLLVMTNPILRNQLRFNLNNQLWQSVYGNLMSTAMPSPQPPEFIPNARKIDLVPYSDTHTHVGPLNVLSAQEIPLNQRYPEVYKRVSFGFGVIHILDKFWPQSNIKVAPRLKPRIDPKRPIEYYVPEVIVKYGTETIFKPPKSLLQWHQNKQGLSWMTLYGHLNTFLKPLPDQFKTGELKDCTHYIDLQWMRKYIAKKDFYQFGGAAYFKFPNDNIFTLGLKYITKIDSEELISVDDHPYRIQNPDPLDLAIKNLASSCGFISVAGLHLAGIHMFYNLVSLALYNVFDVVPHGRQLPTQVHPFRAAMNIHFFNHVLVEEKTTAHLLDPGGVFNQIFALEYPDVLQFVADHFNQIEYASDADLRSRAEVFGGIENLPPNSQIHWQLRYKEIFEQYAKNIVRVIWDTDRELAEDPYMQQFYVELDAALKKRNDNNGTGLPGKYDRFTTREGIVTWIADTMFVIIVMHEVYGTYVPAYATDSDIVPSAIPKDKPVPTLEDYTSLMLVTAATSRVRFPRLIEQDPFAPFSKCQQRYTQILPTIFWNLQKDLRRLETEWTRDADQIYINEQYRRVLPNDLEIAAGY